MTTEEAELIQKLAMSLDTCQDLVDKAARSKKRSGEGKALRPVTWQQRANSFRDLVGEARAVLVSDGKPVYF